MEDDFDELMISTEEGDKRWLDKNESRMINFNDNNFILANKNNVLPVIKVVEKIVFLTDKKQTHDV